MTDTLPPQNSTRPTSLPQRQSGLPPGRGSATPPLQRSFSKGVPPEDPPEEPWEEEELDPFDGQDEQASAPRPGGEPKKTVQLPPRPAYTRPDPTHASATGPRPLATVRSRPETDAPAVSRPSAASHPAQAPRAKVEPEPDPAGRPIPPPVRARSENAFATQNRPAVEPRPLQSVRTQVETASTPEPRAVPEAGEMPVRARFQPGAPSESRPGATSAISPAAPGAGSGRPVLPRMELKPILPVDPEKFGLNVVTAPRVPAPPPPASGAAAAPGETSAPARFAPERMARPLPVSTPPAAPASMPESAESSVPLDLNTLLEQLVNLPAQTAILGVCDDRLPVLIDLNDPAPGALLVASDDNVLRLRLLRTLLQTAAALNSPRSVQFLILSSKPEVWQGWLDGLDIARHCLGVDSLIEGSPERWLLKLSGWADQRRTGSSSGPAVILVVDDLAAVPQLEYDARVNFDWLVKEGPGVRIWPVVSVAAEQTPGLVRWVRLFRTRILGPAQDAALYRQLAAVDPAESATLVQPAQFAVRIQETWLKFRVPGVPDPDA